MNFLERKRIDDPVGATAVHGVGGAWGVLAVGLFANGAAGYGFNGVTSGGVRGLFFGGAWHQLAAQALGGVDMLRGGLPARLHLRQHRAKNRRPPGRSQV